MNDKPQIVFLEQTNRCNAKCTSCLQKDTKRKRGIMDGKCYYELLDEIKEKKIARFVNLYGVGESYLVPDFVMRAEEAVIRLAPWGISTNIITNGEYVEDIPYGITSFVISFNAGREKTYERLCGLPFQDVLNAIDNLNTYDQFKQAIDMQIHMLVWEENKDEINDFLRLFDKYDNIKLRIGFKYDNQCGKIKDQTLPMFRTTQRFPCHYVMNCLNVCWDGTVVSCPHDFEGEQVYGNAFTNSLSYIWNDDYHKELVKKHEAGIFDGLCTSCNYNTSFDGKFFTFRSEDIRGKKIDIKGI